MYLAVVATGFFAFQNCGEFESMKTASQTDGFNSAQLEEYQALASSDLADSEDSSALRPAIRVGLKLSA